MRYYRRMADAPGEAPKKYIRTLESDIRAVKEGGEPDLSPLQETAPPALAPPPPVPVPPPAPAEVRLPGAFVPPPAPAAPPRPANSPIETYASDFSEQVKDTGASALTVLAAQQDAARGAPSAPPPALAPRARLAGLLYTIAGLALLLAGGGGAYYAYSQFLTKNAPVLLMPVASAPIFVDDRQQIGGTGAALAQAIEQSVAHPLATGAVRFLYTNDATSTGMSVFSALQLPAPAVLLRNIAATGSMAGVANISGTASPFFILSVSSYSDTFAGMLAWEPLMPRDLAALFPPYAAAPISATTSAATSTAAAPAKGAAGALPAKEGFSDEVVSNHDARAYRDAQGRTVLLYGYWDQATLIIARDESVFTELLRRLATSRSQ